MKKRILSLLLAVVMLVTVIPALGASAKKGQVFRDVAQNAWYAKFVYPLSEADIISGMDSVPNYKATGTLTRAQFLTMLACSVKSADEFDAYKGLGLCPDAGNTWYSGYINWAAQEGIVPQGQNFRPQANILRSEAVELTYAVHTAHPEVIPLTPIMDATDFIDKADIPESLTEALTACNLAGVIKGDTNGRFNPNNNLNRGEAASMVCQMLEIEPWDESRIPAPPKFEEPKTGSAYGATYVEFDPQYFTAKIALANGKLDTDAHYSSILSGQNAYIAVDGAVFNASSSTKNTYGSFISNGKAIRILRPNPGAYPEPAFVVDSNGKASIQWVNIEQTVTRVGQDGTELSIQNVGLNTSVGANDGTRMIYTRDYATTVSGSVAYAFAVDNNNVITNVYQSTSNVPVPASGYLLFTRLKRDEWTDRYFTQAKVGDKLDRSFNYKGSTTQDVQTLISCGPTILKNGSVYGNSSTYAAEGFDSSSNVVGSGTHMLIGVKADGKVVIACASGSQQTMSTVMKNLGCKDAINVDGGGSLYLSCNGKTFYTPGRNLTNMLVFSKK